MAMSKSAEKCRRSQTDPASGDPARPIAGDSELAKRLPRQKPDRIQIRPVSPEDRHHATRHRMSPHLPRPELLQTKDHETLRPIDPYKNVSHSSLGYPVTISEGPEAPGRATDTESM